MKQLDCPICEESVYSSVGNGCKMCWMPIENGEDFCSKECEIKYNLIHNVRIVKNG